MNDNVKILYETETEFLCVWNSPLDSNKYWSNLIDDKASYNQNKTGIRLERAYCRVYQPNWPYWNNKDFESLEQHMVTKVNTLTEMLGKKKEKRHRLEEGMWGLVYADQETCGPHGHGKSNHYAGTYYFTADPGCGSIFFPTIGIEVEPESGDLILFNSRLMHGVMPNKFPDAKRICVDFNIPAEKKEEDEPV